MMTQYNDNLWQIYGFVRQRSNSGTQRGLKTESGSRVLG